MPSYFDDEYMNCFTQKIEQNEKSVINISLSLHSWDAIIMQKTRIRLMSFL